MLKNKTIAYTLATSLLLGGTFLGTKATLIDEKTTDNNLNLTTGKLQIRLIPGTWVRNAKDKDGDGHITTADSPEYQPNVGKNNTGEFTNVQPGDTFTRYISVLNGNNNSDIALRVKKLITGDNQELMQYIDVDASNLESLKSMDKNTNSGGYITIKIRNSEAAQKAFNGAKNLNLNAAFTVIATTTDGTPVATLEEPQQN